MGHVTGTICMKLDLLDLLLHDSFSIISTQEGAIRFAKSLSEADTSKKEDIISKKHSFLEAETIKLVMNEIDRVEAFIAGLKYCRSYFLILKSSMIEEIRKIVTNITRKKV
jgi:hypothetical protein